MARRNQTDDESPVTLVPLDPEDAEFSNREDAAEDWQNFEFLRDQGEDAWKGMTIWVYRIPTDMAGNPQTAAQAALLFTAPIDTYKLTQVFERVKKEYMPRGFGRTLIRIMVRRDNQRGVLYKQVFPIEKGAQDDEPEVTAKSQGDLTSIAEVFQKALAAQQEQNRQMLSALFQRMNAAPAVDPMAQTERMMTMITGIAGILVQRQAPAGPTQDIAGLLAGFREMMKFSREIGAGNIPEADETESLPKLLEAGKPYIEVLGKLLQRAQVPTTVPVQPVRRRLPPTMTAEPAPHAAAPQVAVPQVAVPQAPVGDFGTMAAGGSAAGGSAAGGGAAQPAPPVEPDPVTGDPMLLQLKKHIGDFCDLLQAEPTTDPVAVATLILDMVPAEYDEKFYAIVSGDDWLSKLAVFDKRVLAHQEFFTKVRDKILAEFDATDAEAQP